MLLIPHCLETSVAHHQGNADPRPLLGRSVKKHLTTPLSAASSQTSSLPQWWRSAQRAKTPPLLL
eukprot:2896722-Pyramimonas_sp.AAC.1